MTCEHFRNLPQAAGDLASWLLEPASLTARCRAASQNFQVRLLSYGRRPIPADEFLGKTPGFSPWVREVLLVCDGVPVIFAHSIRPALPRGRLARWLGKLGESSLGSLLFTHPGFRRGPLEFFRLDSRHSLYRRAARFSSVGRVLWARRRLYYLGSEKLWVTEVFLPPLTALRALRRSATA